MTISDGGPDSTVASYFVVKRRNDETGICRCPAEAVYHGRPGAAPCVSRKLKGDCVVPLRGIVISQIYQSYLLNSAQMIAVAIATFSDSEVTASAG